MTSAGPPNDRPPKPPRRRCDYPGCDREPFLSKDWCTTCREHNGVTRPPRAERASQPEPPIGYWCCALDWSLGYFRASDCIPRTSGPKPEWERIVPAERAKRIAIQHYAEDGRPISAEEAMERLR